MHRGCHFRFTQLTRSLSRRSDQSGGLVLSCEQVTEQSIASTQQSSTPLVPGFGLLCGKGSGWPRKALCDSEVLITQKYVRLLSPAIHSTAPACLMLHEFSLNWLFRLAIPAQEVLQTIKFAQREDGKLIVEDIIEGSTAAQVLCFCTAGCLN